MMVSVIYDRFCAIYVTYVLTGTGLSDGFPTGGIDGTESNKFIEKLPYDVMAIGNHELYLYPIAEDMHKNFAPKWKGRYLTSNVNITVTDKKGKKTTGPLGSALSISKNLQLRAPLFTIFPFRSLCQIQD